MRNDLERVYFFFSFGFLILRTVCVSLYGAWINDESKKPIAILNSVPSFVYNLEVCFPHKLYSNNQLFLFLTR